LPCTWMKAVAAFQCSEEPGVIDWPAAAMTTPLRTTHAPLSTLRPHAYQSPLGSICASAIEVTGEVKLEPGIRYPSWIFTWLFTTTLVSTAVFVPTRPRAHQFAPVRSWLKLLSWFTVSHAAPRSPA